MVFCDSTSSLDCYNTSLFILSTSYPAGGLPLAAMITSDEQESTIQQGLEMIKRVVPSEAFYGCGPDRGPAIVMTDDSSAERNATQKVWPDARLLLCTFHFLQSKWTWLHNANNHVRNEDRQLLMLKTKKLVYASSEMELLSLYSEFQKCELVRKYPNYLAYIQSHWVQRKDWALCYRNHLLVRGNHTNNYAEAGVRIIKELVFNRVKAYNLVQMFCFVTECLEMYYSRKLLSVAHNRVDRYISLKYQGMKCTGIGAEKITMLDKDEQTYLVESQTERGVKYLVDMSVGICSCTGRQDGSPCSHQAAIVKHLGVPSVNCIPTLSLSTRQQIAMIAIGNKAIRESQFYASLHQEKLESVSNVTMEPSSEDFLGPAWDLIQSSLAEISEDENSTKSSNDNDQLMESLEQRITEFTADITARANDTPAIAQAMHTFLRRYDNITKSGTFATARLSSALHRFGWVFGGNTSSSQEGHLRRGRRIPINAKSAGRRRGKVSRGKGKILQGRPKGMKVATYPDIHNMCVKKPPKGKRKHSLQSSIVRETQNTGKW